MKGSEKKEKTRKLKRFAALRWSVIDDERVSKNELLVYLALVRHANKLGNCYPSYQRIADVARLSRKRAIEAIKGLVRLGIVKKEERKSKAGRQTSNFFILADSIFPAPKAESRGVVGTPQGCRSDTPRGVVVTPEVSSLEVEPGKKEPALPPSTEGSDENNKLREREKLSLLMRT